MELHTKLSEHEEYIASQIVDSSLKVHRYLGPGLLEKVYEKCLCYELESRGMVVERQVKLAIVYGSMTFDEGLILD